MPLSKNSETLADRPAALLPELTERLRRRSCRVTASRQAILDILRRQSRPMSIKRIYAALSGADCDLATVYRSMHLLVAIGMVKRFNLGDGAACFELLAEGDDGHHHHLVCTRCDEIVEIQECSIHRLEAEIATRSGFEAVTHQLEFFGICPGCQNSNGSS
jgi:Fur family transcriptional regulator, ferric uptake regulator